jgi:hypothetical protein
MSKGRALESPLPHATNAEGKTAVEVNQFTVLFTAADRKTAVSDRMPLTVKVDGGDAGSYEFEATVEKTSGVEVDLKAKKHAVTPRKDEPAPDLAKVIADAMKATGPQVAAK